MIPKPTYRPHKPSKAIPAKIRAAVHERDGHICQKSGERGTEIHHNKGQKGVHSMSITKGERLQVYNKYGGHCAYCGKEIAFKDMQVDHIEPQRLYWGCEKGQADRIDNLNPSCRRCNHYKRARSVERFRNLISKLPGKIDELYLCKVAIDYGIIKVEPWDGVFYFERGDVPK